MVNKDGSRTVLFDVESNELTEMASSEITEA